jgi:Rrf2 family protein
MASIVHISEAVSIGVHAALCLAAAPERYWSTREILKRYSFSEAHLAKIMAVLVRAGLVVALRGPQGGARLSRPPEQITLLEIYEAIDGPMTMASCLLGSKGCGAVCCQVGPKLAAVNQSMRDYFGSVCLSDLIKPAATGRKQEKRHA